ncbi:MAG: MATE family efflux transporter, partial [Clostridiales bacterium]|nr:MATE family efflux transporter [Clostridiales bacterium]
MRKDVLVNMTEGRIVPQLLRFSGPVLLGLVFQRIYNFVDSFIVGRYLGDNALAAVSVSGVGMYLVTSLILGMTTGISVVLSQYYGARQENEVEETYYSSIYIAIAMTAIVTLAGLLLARPVLILLQTPTEVLPEATLYLQVICAGCVGTMLYNWIASILRALGNSMIPLVFLGVASGLNILFDFLFVAALPFGVAGAAVATILAQLISGVACFIYAWKVLPMCRLKREKMHLNPHIGKQMLRYGIPAGLQMSIISVSDMTLQAVVDTFGTAMVVAYGVAIKMEWIGVLIGDALGTALGTFAGQNTGAGNIPRVQEGFKKTFWLTAAGYAIVSPLIFILAPKIMALFTDSAKAIQYGVEYMRVFSPLLFAVGILTVFYYLL